MEDAILEDVSVAKTIVRCKNVNQKSSIFQCSKIYGNPTNVAQYKVALNLVNPKSLMKKNNVRTLK